MIKVDDFILVVITCLCMQHDGTEKTQSWHLQDVELTIVKGEESGTWVFPCDQWLSCHVGERRMRRDLKGSPKEKETRGMACTSNATISRG